MGHETKETKGKFLAKLLRHNPELIESKIDENGWMETKDLIGSGKFTLEELEEIVRDDQKGRYELSIDKKKIRALQGHSIPGINPELEEVIPPDILYHGTSYNNLGKIFESGCIKKMSRDYIHLSGDKETALIVGARHGKPCYIEIDTREMKKDKIKFWRSKNGVYLCKDSIDIKYFILS